MQAVIMAGGKGTRLAALTQNAIPKPMAPIAGKPILEWQIQNLREQGIKDIILVIGHLGSVIRNHFQDGESSGVHIQYIEEKEPLGTAGALSLLPPLLHGGSFFFAFGDVIFDIALDKMRAYHQAKNAAATLFVHPNAHPFDSDLVVCDADGRIRAFDIAKKRDYWYHNQVNAGLCLFEASICRAVPGATKTDLERELLTGLLREGAKIYGYRSPEYIKDVGTVERLQAAEQELIDGYPAKRSLRNKQKAVFLDRDGTINTKAGLVYREDQFQLEHGVADAIRQINRSGRLAIVVTNQPVVARGLCGIQDIERIHAKMETLLGQEGAYLDAVYYCPHHPDRGYPEENSAYKIPCRCRKPGIGMIEQAVRRFNIDLSESWLVGDTTVDVQTGKNAGTKTALVLTGDAGKDRKYAAEPDIVAANLEEAVGKIIGGE